MPRSNPIIYTPRVKLHPRVRACIKWTCTAAVAALVIAWIINLRFMVVWNTALGYYAWLYEGRLVAGCWRENNRGSRFLNQGLHMGDYSNPHSVKWWFNWDSNGMPAKSTPNQEAWELNIPLWSLMLPCALPAFALWRRDIIAARQSRIGRCLACSYDRRGLDPAAPCPECGEKRLNIS